MQKGTNMSHNDQRTRAFTSVDNSANESRRKVVVAIFVVVALILAAFATLIIGKIVSQLPEKTPSTLNQDLTYVPKDAGDLYKGNLLHIDSNNPYEIPDDFSNMINLYAFRNNAANVSLVELNGKLTYSLTADDIALEVNTCNAFNHMILDYCQTLDMSSANQNSASNLVVAWGGYTIETYTEYPDDIANISASFVDHGLGTTLTLKTYDPSTVITEEILKKNFLWIYENAHKYGFIIRYPDACKDHTGFDSSKRVHLR